IEDEVVTTYGFSPTCMTSASPSRRTMASSNESSSVNGLSTETFRLRAASPLVATGRRPRLVHADHLHELDAARLVRGDDAFGAEVLQHSFVRVVGRTDAVRGRQCRVEPRERHRTRTLDDAREHTRRREPHEHFVADEIEPGV